MDKLKVAGNFSRYAHLYDRYADIQKKAAFELVRSLNGDTYAAILEVGCGTGNYTLMLKERFSAARIKALDISAKMVEVARTKLNGKGVEFSVADGQELKLAERFTLITSNACFQWFDDLESALNTYKGLLARQGAIAFTVFGPSTFMELNAAIKEVLNLGTDSSGFVSGIELGRMLRANFNSVKISERRYQEEFTGLKELLEKIKFSGVRGNGLGKKIPFSRRVLKELEDAYRDKFGRIRATYQVFLCRGEAS